MQYPGDILLEPQGMAGSLPVCDHYCGVEARMRKSLALQAEFSEEFGACVFDVTLDCEDGAPVGGEREHASMVAALACEAVRAGQHLPRARVAVRVHAVDHPSFEQDIETVVGGAASALCHLMLPGRVGRGPGPRCKVDRRGRRAGRADRAAAFARPD
jgi:citrate lyase subunit beta/citryl-CoA lyase